MLLKEHSRSFKNRDHTNMHGDIITSTSTSTLSPKTFTCKVPSDILRNLRAEFMYDNNVVELAVCLMVKLPFRLGRVVEKPSTHCTAC